MGCYVAGRGGRTFDLDFSYGAYSAWIGVLAFWPSVSSRKKSGTIPAASGANHSWS